MPLEINGEFTTPKLIFRAPRTAVPAGQERRGSNATYLPRLAASWRSVPHWDVPPAFEYPRKALEELGVEAYKEATKQYYEAIREQGVERAQRTHGKWAVRQVLRTFETHIRGFRRQEVSSRGGLFAVASDELIHPQVLWDRGQLMADLEGIIARYQVRVDLRPLAVRLARATLKQTWDLV